jgi:hypothetical protein
METVFFLRSKPDSKSAKAGIIKNTMAVAIMTHAVSPESRTTLNYFIVIVLDFVINPRVNIYL